MIPYSHSQDEANRQRCLADDQTINAARPVRNSAAQISLDAQARKSAEAKLVQLKKVLRALRDHHINVERCGLASVETCDVCRLLDEAIKL